MNVDVDFEDRIAARLLGVSLDADVATIKARFRTLVLEVHPDRSVGDACVDLGRLAEAKDRLVDLATRRAEANRQAASRLVDALRAPAQPEADVVDFSGWQPSRVNRRAFEFVDHLGQRIDIAG